MSATSTSVSSPVTPVSVSACDGRTDSDVDAGRDRKAAVRCPRTGFVEVTVDHLLQGEFDAGSFVSGGRCPDGSAN